MGFPEVQGGHQGVPWGQGGCLGLKGVKGEIEGVLGGQGVPGA